MRSDSFLLSVEPLTQLLEREGNMLVRDKLLGLVFQEAGKRS